MLPLLCLEVFQWGYRKRASGRGGRHSLLALMYRKTPSNPVILTEDSPWTPIPIHFVGKQAG